MPLSPALASLAPYRQFIVVRTQPKPNKPGKTDKFPINPYTGHVDASAHNPAIWLAYEDAERLALSGGPSYGVGFVLTENDPFWCLDIDEALNGVGWTPFAQGLCARLPGCAIEISQSGKGLHVWGAGGVVGQDRRKRRDDLHIELYSELRFIMLGQQAGVVGSIAAPNPTTTAAVQALIAEFLPPDPHSGVDVPQEGASPDWRGPTDDAELLRRALQSKSTRSMFGGAASFADLWDANEEALTRAYPAAGGGYDASAADAALAQHLAFWTGRDVARIERLMRQSALARPKWDDHGQYLVGLTIRGACGRQTQVLQDKEVEASPTAQRLTSAGTSTETPQQHAVTGTTFLNATAQTELFKGCVYIVDQHRVLIPGGALLKEGQFKATYGGYTFAMDNANQRTSRNAWEAFTESQVLRCPRADGTCFRPDLPPAAVIHEGGRTLANIWWPVDVPCEPGDATPFLRHLAKLLPDERDRLILLSYMAACVQYPGKKFQWAPLIQGVEGNGKTMLSACVAKAIGERYVFWPKAKKIAAQFNAWLFGNVFYAVEDIHTPEGHDVIEELKPMITASYGIEIESKGVDQASRTICGNFLFNSNHKSGLRKTQNDRRFCVLYCAQQRAEDLARDGMDGDYMKGMYAWLNDGGFAVVTHFLKTYAIPDQFNPHPQLGRCQRAPTTTSTAEALEHGRGRVEQEVLEAIEQDLPGFAGGWVSSLALDRLLDRLGKAGAVPLARRREMMQSLGYDWHPALSSGRVNNPVMPDGGKPKLFVRNDHPMRTLMDGAEVARQYSLAQGIGVKP